MSGEAEVFREDSQTGDLDVLAQLVEGAYVGENSLLEEEVRYAGVKATSRLLTMSIHKKSFETAIGTLDLPRL